MNYFKKAIAENDFVFLAEVNNTDAGQVALVLQKAHAGDEITLDDALTNTHNAGSFVFTKDKINFPDQQAVKEFSDKVQKILTESNFTRALIWLYDSREVSVADSAILGFTNTDYTVAAHFDIVITNALSIRVLAKVKIEVSDTGPVCLLFTAGSAVISFLGTRAVKSLPIENAAISMAGANRGTFVFNASVTQTSFISNFRPGFQFLFSPLEAKENIVNEFFPLIASGEAGENWNFSFQVDPVNIFNQPLAGTHREQYDSRRTCIDLLPLDSGDPLLIQSFYRTVFNEPVSLRAINNNSELGTGLPSRFLFTKSKTAKDDDFIVSPEGEFVLYVDNAEEDKPQQFLCSISGTEYISFMPYSTSYPGDILLFIGLQAAYLDTYPLPQASPTGPPTDAERDLLNNRFTTAYAYLHRNNGTDNCHYVSQPKGMEMYGYDNVVHKSVTENPLGFIELGFALPPSQSVLFPLVPYAGIKPGDGLRYAKRDQILNIEWGVIFPKRRREISKVNASISLSSRKSLHKFTDSNPPLSSATPSGQVAIYDSTSGSTSDVIKELILGRTNEDEIVRKISFTDPGKELTEAMMTKDLFLVIANSKYLGTLLNGADPVAGPSFNNTVQIENWFFNIKPGSNTYGKYSNVVIIKGRPGILYKENLPPENWLISNPDQWTAPNQFAAPSTTTSNGESQPDRTQLSALTRWLIDYFKNCSEEKDNPYYQDLLEKAASINWTGILILQADIDFQKVPDGIAALLNGITDLNTFKAHHIGISLSQIEKAAQGPDMSHASSLFGLITYEDRMFRMSESGIVQPVIAETSDDYNFKVLNIKVLFSNSSVKAFENYSQLIINKLFNMPVSGMSKNGNPLNAIIIKGLYQKRNEVPYYSLDTIDSYAFYFNNNIFKKIEVTSASLYLKKQMQDGSSESVFNLNGFLDFEILKYKTEDKVILMDILSFGSSATDISDEYKGLNYGNLEISMISAAPGNGNNGPTYKQNSSGLSFDIAASTTRENSLYRDFALDIFSWVDAEYTYKPEEYGYFGVVTELNLNKIATGKTNCWYGIEFKLDLGSPGELAGEVGLDAYLLFAWAPSSKGEDRYEFFVGLKLPGLGGSTKIIDIQNVLKLSIGQSKLLYVPKVAGGDPQNFMLLLTDIALKFMGFLKIPPNGSTSFYLFGNKAAAGQPSSLGWYAFYKKDSTGANFLKEADTIKSTKS